MMDKPNVLFFLTDQQRHDWVGMSDTVPVRTPTLESLAEEGAWFTNAVCPSPLCGPSRACLASGMEYDRCGVLDHSRNYPTDQPTYYGRLRDEAGYHVMGCGKFDLHKPEFSWGIEGDYLLEEWGFSDGVDSAGKWATRNSWQEHGGPNDPYMHYLAEHGLAEKHLEDFRRRGADRPADTYPTPLPDHAYNDNFIARQGLELLESAPADQPWHLVVNFAGPHDPWDVTEEMHAWYRDPDVKFPEPLDPDPAHSPEVHQEVRRNYAAMVENVDDWLAKYLTELEARGERENTVIVWASDHGELLGEHQDWRKKSPYQSSVGVPLVVTGPHIDARGKCETPVSLLDLHATFLDYAGLDAGDVDSRSLVPYLEGKTDTHRDVVYSGLGPWRLVFDGRHKLIEGFDFDRPSAEQVDAFIADHDTETYQPEQTNTDPVLFDVTGGERENIAVRRSDLVERLSTVLDTFRIGQRGG